MIALAAFIGLGALQFLEQPLPGLNVSSRAFPAGLARVNTVAADLDRDGVSDLLLRDGVWLQREGVFPRTAMVPLPEHERDASIFIENGHMYAFAGTRLTSYSYVAQSWQADWEASVDFESGAYPADAPLFHDLDADGRAELLLPLDESIRIFRIAPGAPPAGNLSVYPPIRPRLTPITNLWSSVPTRSPSATSSRDAHITLTDLSLIVREALRVTEDALERRISVYKINRSGEDLFAAELVSESTFPALPETMVGCHLRKGGPIAFAGARPLPSTALRLGQTITEVLTAVDFAIPPKVLRTKAVPAHIALADFDADGDYDLLTQSNTLDSRPPREIIMALASARRIRHEFFVHVQSPSGDFDPRPRKIFSADLDLGRPTLEGGPRWDAYRRGELTCSAADFNGDGRADIAAWSTVGRIDIWLNQEGIFGKKPDAAIQPGDARGFTPADVDADGKADLVLLPEPGNGTPMRVFFSR